MPLILAIDSFHSVVYTGTEVDKMGSTIVKFRDGGFGSCQMEIQGSSSDDVAIFGSEGKIKLFHFWKCQKAKLCDIHDNLIESFEDILDNGFEYEIQSFEKAWKDKSVQLEAASHEISLECTKYIDVMRKNTL